MVSNIAAILKIFEKVSYKDMPDRIASAIVFEVRFSDISYLIRAIDQHMVPRLGTGRLGLIRLIPSFVCLAGLIAVDNNPPVTIPLMVYQLS